MRSREFIREAEPIRNRGDLAKQYGDWGVRQPGRDRYGQDISDFARIPDAQVSVPATPSAPPAATDSTPVASAEPQPSLSVEQSRQLVTQLKAAYRRDYGQDLEINSAERTRAQQADLYQRWQRGEQGIFKPINPEQYPGRDWFHLGAVDITVGRVDADWMQRQGWIRPDPQGDPVHWEYRGSAPSAAQKPAGSAAQPQTGQAQTAEKPKRTGNPELDAWRMRQQKKQKK